MADEEKNEQEAPEATEETAPEEEATEETAPEEEAKEEAPEAAEEAAEAPAEEAAEAPAEPPAAAAEAGDDEQPETPTPKQVRKRARAAHSGEARPQRSAEERAGERDASRKQSAAARRRYRGNLRGKKGDAKAGTPPTEREPGPRKLRQGIVTSSKADKTITVEIESARRHPTYEKIVRRSKSLRAHDEHNEAGEGDTVRVIETRPMSKTKRWRLVEVIEKAK